MVPVTVLTLDISFHDDSLREIEFRDAVSPYLSYLDSLRGALGKNNYAVDYCPPENRNGKPTGWSLRCILTISVGKNRAEHLILLFEAIVRLIDYELPDFEVDANAEILHFS